MDITAARQMQIELSKKLRIQPLLKSPSSIAGVDAAFDGDLVIAVVSLFEYPSFSDYDNPIATHQVFWTPSASKD